MGITRKIGIVFILLLFLQISFAGLMTAEESDKLFGDLYKQKAEEQNNCIRAYYASEYGVTDEKNYIGLTINQINVASIECSTDPCTKPCQVECCEEKSWSCTMECVSNCVGDCHKPEYDSCKAECASYGEETGYRYENGICGCFCRTTTVIYGGKCLSINDAKAQGYDPNTSDICARNSDCDEGELCKGGSCVGDYSCETTADCYDGEVCENGECVTTLECYNDIDCSYGYSCVKNKCVENDTCQDNSDCPAMHECVNEECVPATGELELIIDKKIVLMDKTKEVNLTAKISGARSGYVDFEINDPKLIFSYGTIHKVSSINSSGIAKATFKFPKFSEISEIKADYFPYVLNVKATAEIGNKKTSDSGTITLKSPAPKITSISINPSPVESYKTYTITIKVEDADDSSLKYSLVTAGNVLAKNEGSGKSSAITLGGGKTISAILYGPEFGFNMTEIQAAREVTSALKGGAISAGVTLTKKKMDDKAIDLAIKGSLQKGRRLLRWIPIIGTGKTIYDMWGSANSAGEITGSLIDSANWKEALYRGLDLGAEGIRFAGGAANILLGEVPIIGNLSDLTQDAIDVGIGAGQSYLKSKALEARALEAEGINSTGVITVVVEDNEGYRDKKVHLYDELFYYVGWGAE